MIDDKSTVAGFLLLAGFLVVAGCSETIKDPDGGGTTNPDTKPAPLSEQVYVGVDQFEQFRQKGAVVLDVRGEEVYDEGHVPGAVRAPWDKFKEDDSDGAFIESEVSRLQQAARSLGIDRDEKVLVYGPASSTLPARQAWSLEYIGHGQVHILDGGLPAWEKNAEAELSTEIPDVERGSFKVDKRSSILAEDDDIEAASDDEKPIVLFDARSESEYEGTDDRDNPRHGHVPGAIHYNWKNVYDEDGRLRSKSAIRAELEQKGLLKDGALVIPYCQGGFRSAVVYSILRWLGREDVKNYDGSWYEYSRNTEWEVEKK